MAARQRRFETRVFFLLDELSSQTDEPHLPKALVFRCQVTRLHPSPISSSSSTGLISEPHEQARRWTQLSEAVGDVCHEGHFIDNGSLSPLPPLGYDNIILQYMKLSCIHKYII